MERETKEKESYPVLCPSTQAYASSYSSTSLSLLLKNNLPLNNTFHPSCMHEVCPTLYDPTGRSPPGSSVHGILQTRILEWVTMFSSRGSSLHRDWTHVSFSSCIGGRLFTAEPPGSPFTLHPTTILLLLPSIIWNYHLLPPPFPPTYQRQWLTFSSDSARHMKRLITLSSLKCLSVGFSNSPPRCHHRFPGFLSPSLTVLSWAHLLAPLLPILPLWVRLSSGPVLCLSLLFTQQGISLHKLLVFAPWVQMSDKSKLPAQTPLVNSG